MARTFLCALSRFRPRCISDKTTPMVSCFANDISKADLTKSQRHPSDNQKLPPEAYNHLHSICLQRQAQRCPVSFHFRHQLLGLRNRQGPPQFLCSSMQYSFRLGQLEAIEKVVDLPKRLIAVFNMMNLGCKPERNSLALKAFCDVSKTIKRPRKKVDLIHQ